MSYILDALRKSEQQRQQGAAPTLSSAPTAVPTGANTGKPAGWIVWLSGLLLLAAGIALGILRPWQPPAHVTYVPPALVVQAAPMPTTPAPIAPPPAEPVVATPPPGLPAALPAPDPVVAPPSPPPPVAVPKAPVVVETPKALPPLSLTVHAYSPDAADRIAGINGKLLREGEEVSPGLKLERITIDGVILNYQGKRFRRSMN